MFARARPLNPAIRCLLKAMLLLTDLEALTILNREPSLPQARGG
jgi:hypothetical protein